MQKKGIQKGAGGWAWVGLFVGLLMLTGLTAVPAGQAAGTKEAPASFAGLVKAASPSVVYISTVRVVKGRGGPPAMAPDDPFRDFFERFFGDQMPRNFRQQGLGSGFIMDKEGHIVTNNHVVEKSDEIRVKLPDGSEYDAKIIGRDPTTDLALIKIDADTELKPLPLGDSDKLEVGDWVVAIGNPFGLENTVSAGIVSAKYRRIGTGKYENFIQTDASINRGNSGGPLLNTAGEVVGINSVIISPGGGSIGIGFAIPINMAKDILPQLKQGKVVRGWLGVLIQKITPELKDKLGLQDVKGALVADVTAGGPAEKAGIERGDVIVSFDGREIQEMSELPYAVGSTPVGKKVKVGVVRKGKLRDVEVKVGELAEEGTAAVSQAETRPELGMAVETLTPELAKQFGLSETSGVVIAQVQRGTPAGEAGLRPGDLILEVDQSTVRTVEDLNRSLKDYKTGDTILFLVKRGGSTLYLTLKIYGE